VTTVIAPTETRGQARRHTVAEPWPWSPRPLSLPAS